MTTSSILALRFSRHSLRQCINHDMRHGVSSVYRTYGRSINHHGSDLTLRRYSTADNAPQKIAVLGGGITGLASAYYLAKSLPRAEITIFEGSSRIGGWLSSKRVEVSGGSVLFEGGPRSLRTAGNGVLAINLIEELGLKDDTIFTPTSVPAANHRYVYYPDRLVRMPHPKFGILDMAQTLLSEPIFEGVPQGLVKESFVPVRSKSVQDESIGDFLGRRFGQPLVDQVVSAVYHGIYAGDVYQLSARSLMSRFWREEPEGADRLLPGLLYGLLRTMGSEQEMPLKDATFFIEVPVPQDEELVQKLRATSVYTFRDGIGMLIDKLAHNLVLNGRVTISTDMAVSSVRLNESGSSVELKVKDGRELSFDHVISALSPSHLSSLTPDDLPVVPSVTVMTASLFYKDAHPLPPGPTPDRLGFGYLIPRATELQNNPERALGVVFDNAYAPPRINGSEEPAVYQDSLDKHGTKVTVMLGGHWWNDWPSYPDEQEGLDMAKATLKQHLGIQGEPEAYQINLQRDCIPQYTVGHEDRLKIIHNKLWRAYKGRLRVAGSWIYGVGVNDCLRSAYEVVKQLEDGKDGTGLDHIGSDQLASVRIAPRV